MKHYSGLSYYFGGRFIRYMNANFFPVHFSPFIPFQTLKLKYGVVSASHITRDLDSWRWFTLPGRMHKPIVTITPKCIDLLLHTQLSRKQAIAL
jgi:translocator assembly and maintenance protein 41